ncbi:MAG: restriction endonuclease subunit S [Marinobacter sp.]|uniref:restriction endonuclease subunit S n=1 Tax=Marinobacter sp. TaxID=50741 RepID=UPI003F9AAD84
MQTVGELVEDGTLARPMDGNHGGIHPKASDYVDHGIPFIMASDLDGGRVDLAGCKFISEEQARSLRKGVAKAGDILLSHKATIGRTALVQRSEYPFVMLTPQVTYYRINKTEKLVPNYLKAYFDSYFFQTILAQWAGAGSTRAYLGITGQLKLPIVVPPIKFQNVVASQAEVLNNKIQLNHQINQTLEQMAQAIFKSWFVDFAKIAALEAGGSEEDALLAAMQAISGTSLCNADASAAGAQAELTRLQAEQPEQYAELRATAERFPSAMQDSELGKIPKGWRPVQVEHFIELSYGKALKKTVRIDGPYPVYGSGGITGSHNEPLVFGPGIIVGRKGTVGSIYWESKDFYPIDTAYYVSPKNGGSLSFSYYLLQTLGLKEMNTDAAVPGLNRNNVYRLEIPFYPVPIIERFTQIVDSISRKISASNAESELLTEFRDSLLPKLLFGELSITDAECQLAEAEEVENV